MVIKPQICVWLLRKLMPLTEWRVPLPGNIICRFPWVVSNHYANTRSALSHNEVDLLWKSLTWNSVPGIRIKMNAETSVFKTLQKENADRVCTDRSSRKRRASHLGWLLAGCCFSKKNKKDDVEDDVSVQGTSESHLETSDRNKLLTDAADIGVLELPSRDACLDVDEVIETNDDVPTEAEILSTKLDAGDIESSLFYTEECKKRENGEEKLVKLTLVVEETCEDKQKKGKGKKAKRKDSGNKKPPPNYFVAFQVDNAEIHNSLQNVQECLVMNKKLMERALISLPSLHITFVVMHIDQPDTLKRATEALEASYDKVKDDLEKNPLCLTFEGLSTFRNKVLFADVKDDEGRSRLLNVQENIVSCFESFGFDVRERGTFTPHLTVAKLSRDPSLYRKGLKIISPEWYEDYKEEVFGSQFVSSLQLLKMAKDGETGYYPCHKECFFLETSTSSEETKVPLKEMLLKSLQDKKEIRQKFHDITTQKLQENE